jgi:hypothetical protein
MERKKMKRKIWKATLIIAVLLMSMALMANFSILNANETAFIRADGSVASSIAQVEFDGNFVTPSSTDWWPMFRHDLKHTGYTTSEAPTTNNTVWIYQTGDVIYSSPSVVNGVVFVGSFDHNVYALEAKTGALICARARMDRYLCKIRRVNADVNRKFIDPTRRFIVPPSPYPQIEIGVEKDSIRNFIAKLAAKYRLGIQVLRGFASLSMYRRAMERARKRGVTRSYTLEIARASSSMCALAYSPPTEPQIF